MSSVCLLVLVSRVMMTHDNLDMMGSGAELSSASHSMTAQSAPATTTPPNDASTPRDTDLVTIPSTPLDRCATPLPLRVPPPLCTSCSQPQSRKFGGRQQQLSHTPTQSHTLRSQSASPPLSRSGSRPPRSSGSTLQNGHRNVRVTSCSRFPSSRCECPPLAFAGTLMYIFAKPDHLQLHMDRRDMYLRPLIAV